MSKGSCRIGSSSPSPGPQVPHPPIPRAVLVGRVLLRLQPRQHFVGRKAGGVDGAAADAGATNRSACGGGWEANGLLEEW